MHQHTKIKLFVLTDMVEFEKEINDFLNTHYIVKLFPMGMNNDVLVIQYRETF